MDLMREESEIQRELSIQLRIEGPLAPRLFQISQNT
jgi:hypothetical protein